MEGKANGNMMSIDIDDYVGPKCVSSYENFNDLCDDVIMSMEISDERNEPYFQQHIIMFIFNMSSQEKFLQSMKDFINLLELGEIARCHRRITKPIIDAFSYIDIYY